MIVNPTIQKEMDELHNLADLVLTPNGMDSYPENFIYDPINNLWCRTTVTKHIPASDVPCMLRQPLYKGNYLAAELLISGENGRTRTSLAICNNKYNPFGQVMVERQKATRNIIRDKLTELAAEFLEPYQYADEPIITLPSICLTAVNVFIQNSSAYSDAKRKRLNSVLDSMDEYLTCGVETNEPEGEAHRVSIHCLKHTSMQTAYKTKSGVRGKLHFTFSLTQSSDPDLMVSMMFVPKSKSEMNWGCPTPTGEVKDLTMYYKERLKRAAWLQDPEKDHVYTLLPLEPGVDLSTNDTHHSMHYFLNIMENGNEQYVGYYFFEEVYGAYQVDRNATGQPYIHFSINPKEFNKFMAALG